MSSLRGTCLVLSAFVVIGACSSSSGNASSSGSNGSGSGSGSGGASDSLTQSFGASGGSLSGPNGFDLSVPAGALSSSVNVTVSGLGSGGYPSSMPAFPSNWTLQSLVYEFQPSGQAFAKPVTLTLPYSGASGAFVGTTEPGGSWSTASGATFGSSLATLTTSHFSFYGVFTIGSSTNGSGTGNSGSDGGGPTQPCGDGCTNSAGSCVNGVCTCVSGYTSCNNVCVNTQLDDMNCGGCGIACADSCTQGECEVTLSSSESAVALAVDASNLYWANSSGSIVRVGISGGAPETLLSSLNAPLALALDASNVYFTLGNGNVESVPKAGGSALTLASGQGGVLGLAVGNGHVYWGATNGDLTYRIFSVAVTGTGAVTVLAETDGAAYALAVNGTKVYWTTKTGLFSASVTSLGDFDGGGPPATPVATPGCGEVAALAIDPSDAYWGTFAAGAGTVQKVALGGGSPAQLAGAQYGPNGLAVDTKSIYWTTQEGLVLKLPLGGGTPSTLASVSNGGTAIVVDATTVYWASGNTVQKITPK